MTFRSTLLCTAAVAAALLGTTVTASAVPSLTALQTDTFHFNQLSGSTSLLFDGFDSALGTLTSVHLTLSETASLNDTAAVFPAGPGPQAVGNPTPLTASATVSITGSAGLFASASVTTPGFVGTVPDDGIVHIVGTVTNAGSGVSDLFSPPTNLSSYIGGTSSVSLLLAEIGTQGGSVPNTVLSGNNGTADVTVTLQYDYTVATVDTPEPGTMAILGTSLVGVGLLRRRRQG